MCRSFVNCICQVCICEIVPMCSLTDLSFQDKEHSLYLLWGRFRVVYGGCVVRILGLVCLLVLIVYVLYIWF
jgi:hypothetical protein